MATQLDMAPQAVEALVPMRRFAHDLRNLFAVVGSAKYLLEQPLTDERRTLIIGALERVAVDGRSLTSALLAGGDMSEPHGFDASLELSSLSPLLRSLACSGPSIGIQCDAGPAFVAMARSEFEAVLLELVSNAKRAGAQTIAIRGMREGERFVLLIDDDGRGFVPPSPAELERRAAVAGLSGTGLPRIAAAVRSCGGSFEIISGPGAGTSIAIAIPCMLPAVADPATDPARVRVVSC